jgi:hypothetical protein
VFVGHDDQPFHRNVATALQDSLASRDDVVVVAPLVKCEARRRVGLGEEDVDDLVHAALAHEVLEIWQRTEHRFELRQAEEEGIDARETQRDELLDEAVHAAH